jgi:ABC-type sugar transport system ATPase subunit
MTGLTFRDVSKQFGATVAVDRLSLDVAEGEFVALVGPSGCGKTTSLRMLAGLEEVTSGRVFVGHRDVTALAARDRNLAMVFQSYALYPHLTVAENIGFALSLQGLPKAVIAARVQQAADRLAIGHLLDRRPKALSGGQRQRVAVARCIVREPAAFLFDEPLSNLDARLRGTARIEIARLQKSLGITTLYVTHDQVEAMTMADRVVLMDAGRIRQSGAPMDLYHQPVDVFVAAFLGSPGMNLLAAEVRSDGAGLSVHAAGIEVPLAPGAAVVPGPATLGLRPEALERAEATAGRTAVHGFVLHVEHLGAETLVQVALRQAPDTILTARIPGGWAVRPPEAVALTADTAALHLFDAAGRAVRGAFATSARAAPARRALA